MNTSKPTTEINTTTPTQDEAATPTEAQCLPLFAQAGTKPRVRSGLRAGLERYKK